MSFFARSPQRRRFAATAFALAAASLTLPAGAAAPTVIHNFAPANAQSVNTDGVYPGNGVTQGSDGDWYGTALGGGLSSGGTLFKMHPDGSGFTVLKTFSPSNQAADGGYPGAPLRLGIDGALYGTTSNGGANGSSNSSGTIFRVSPTGQFQLLHSFPANNADPAHGGGQVFQAADGILYGDFDTIPGNLFRMNSDGTGYQTIHTFAAKNSDTTNIGGAFPESVSVVGADGDLYGVATNGGAHGGGTVFKIAKDGTGFTVLHDFNAANPLDGANPSADLIKGQDGAFYGLTSQGGANNTGIVFKIDMNGNFQQIVGFPALLTGGVNSLGANPTEEIGLAQGPDGTLYGSTIAGGAYGYGTLFALKPNGSGFTSLLDFKQSDIQTTFPNLGNQFSVSYGSNGLLYFNTGGGANGTGSLLTLPVPSTHLLWANTNGTAAVWNLTDANPPATAFTAGPYPNWTPKAIAQGPDGHTRLLWTNTSGQTALWNLSDLNPPATAFVAGPYSGWTATALTVGPDNAAHLLWNNTDGRLALWNTTDPNPGASAPVYGPYSGWTGVAIGIGNDNHERLLWDNTSGQVAVWNLSDVNPGATAVVAGPYNGWTAKRLSVGADNAAHLLWDNVSGQVAIWNLSDANPGATALAYGPYGGWSGQDLSVGADNKGQLLWDNVSGQNSLWNLSDANPLATYTLAGPYSGWTAVSVSAAR
jgi:uncharacterized repeat protein (TIGR03803 family)